MKETLCHMTVYKFQSVLADDFLEFFLDYFPELKRRRVDSIPGEQRSRPTASRWSWRVGSGPCLGGLRCAPWGRRFGAGPGAQALSHRRSSLTPWPPFSTLLFCPSLSSGLPVPGHT